MGSGERAANGEGLGTEQIVGEFKEEELEIGSEGRWEVGEEARWGCRSGASPERGEVATAREGATGRRMRGRAS